MTTIEQGASLPSHCPTAFPRTTCVWCDEAVAEAYLGSPEWAQDFHERQDYKDWLDSRADY